MGPQKSWYSGAAVLYDKLLPIEDWSRLDPEAMRDLIRGGSIGAFADVEKATQTALALGALKESRQFWTVPHVFSHIVNVLNQNEADAGKLHLPHVEEMAYAVFCASLVGPDRSDEFSDDVIRFVRLAAHQDGVFRYPDQLKWAEDQDAIVSVLSSASDLKEAIEEMSKIKLDAVDEYISAMESGSRVSAEGDL